MRVEIRGDVSRIHNQLYYINAGITRNPSDNILNEDATIKKGRWVKTAEELTGHVTRADINTCNMARM